MKKMCRRDFLWLAFGIGCVITMCLPVEWLVRILAIAVIILGIICCTNDGRICFMKVVVISPPKFAAPLIRMIFKIKKA